MVCSAGYAPAGKILECLSFLCQMDGETKFEASKLVQQMTSQLLVQEVTDYADRHLIDINDWMQALDNFHTNLLLLDKHEVTGQLLQRTLLRRRLMPQG